MAFHRITKSSVGDRSFSILLAVILTLIIGLYGLQTMYWQQFDQQVRVFPIEVEKAQLLPLQPGSVLEQQFKVTHEGLHQFHVLFPYSNDQPDSQARLRILGGEQPLAVDLSSVQLQQSPLLVIDVLESFPKDAIVTLQLAVSPTNTVAFPAWVQANKALKQTEYGGTLKLNGETLEPQLVFAPKYKEVNEILVGDHFSFIQALHRMQNSLIANKPAWVQSLFWLVACLFWPLFFIFCYQVIHLGLDGLPSNDRRNVQWFLLLSLIIAIIIL